MTVQVLLQPGLEKLGTTTKTLMTVRIKHRLVARLSVGASGTGTSGQADTVEEVGLDRTHPQEASVQHHTPSPDLEPAWEEKERSASQQLEARH